MNELLTFFENELNFKQLTNIINLFDVQEDLKTILNKNN